MDFWLTYIDEDPEQTVEVGRAAEAAGYRGIALADHVAVPVLHASQHPSGGPSPFDHRSPFPDPLVTAAALLAATATLEVMTYVYVLPMREPFSVASQVATLDVLSGGRFRFGVGAGWLLEEIALLGHAIRNRGRRMDEMIEIVRRFWTQESVDFHGEFFDFEAAGIAPQPHSPVPIWIGGKSRAALARAARNDGWLGMNYDLPEVYELLDALAEARAGARASAPARAPAGERFEIFVIPNAPPSTALYAGLSARGVTSTVGPAWGYGDRGFASLDSKRKAIEAFAAEFIGGTKSGGT